MTLATAERRMSAYDSPQLWAHLDSLEGVPDIFEPRLTPKKSTGPQAAAHEGLQWLGVMLPGIGLAFLLAYLGYVLSEIIGGVMHYDHGKSPISPITLAVVFGLLIRNTIGVPKAYEPGLRLCIKTVLRLGIVILGLTLSVKALGRDVLWGLPVIVCCITCALVVITFLNKALGLPRRLGTLIAVGTSICGVSAIVATAPIIDAEEDETSYAVACITIFGLIALLSYPFLAHVMFDPTKPAQAGTFLGTAIHDTSQVAGAGLAYAQQYSAERAMKTAVTVKLVRNLCMAVLIPLMAVLYRRGEQRATGKKVQQPWHQILPLFVIGFVAMACIRSLGDQGERAFGVVSRDSWNHVGDIAKTTAPWLLATALGAVGLGTGLAKLKGLGLKPFSVGLAAALLVGVVSTALIKVLASFM
jgi:uncharacterized integral membrane protein (TIGR00698 family)